MSTDLKSQMLWRLIDGGTWMWREELAADLSSSPLAIDDALADLVIEGKAEFRENAGYRLIGGAIARRAAQLMRKKRAARFVCGEQHPGEYLMGVAEMRRLGPAQELSLVMYEMALPMKPNTQHLDQAQLQAVLDFTSRETEIG